MFAANSSLTWGSVTVVGPKNLLFSVMDIVRVVSASIALMLPWVHHFTTYIPALIVILFAIPASKISAIAGSAKNVPIIAVFSKFLFV